jgi:hypothetical protein
MPAACVDIGFDENLFEHLSLFPRKEEIHSLIGILSTYADRTAALGLHYFGHLEGAAAPMGPACAHEFMQDQDKKRTKLVEYSEAYDKNRALVPSCPCSGADWLALDREVGQRPPLPPCCREGEHACVP